MENLNTGKTVTKSTYYFLIGVVVNEKLYRDKEPFDWY